MTTTSAEIPTSTPPPAVTDSQPISGASLLASLEDLFKRHVVLPEGVPLILALWAIHTHIFEIFDYCPYLALVSPVKRCGKTTVLKLLAGVAKRPEFTVNVSDAALFRLVDDRQPTLLMDEVENLQRSTLRAILNAGFEQGAKVPRCVGGQVEEFQVFCPKAMASIGRLPDTIADRSIIVRMKRKKRGEKVDALRRRTLGDVAALAEDVRAWAIANEHSVAEAYEHNSVDVLFGREADVWEGLFAIVRVAAPERLDELKATAIRLVAEKDAEDEDSGANAIRLLSDIKTILATEGVEVMPTAQLLCQLRSLPDAPWARLSGNELARQLRPFEICPNQLWVNRKNVRGYQRRDFVDAFERYVAPAQDNVAEDSRQMANKASGLAPLEPREHELPWKYLRCGGIPVSGSNRGQTVGKGDLELQDQDATERVIGFMDRQGGHFPYARRTGWTREHEAEYLAVRPFIRRIDELAHLVAPDEWAEQWAVAQQRPEYVMFGTAFSTGTINLGIRCRPHRDNGNLSLTAMTVTDLSPTPVQGGELFFLEYLHAIKIRNGDLLLFDGNALHATAQFYTPGSASLIHGIQRLSCIFYYRKRLAMCLPPEEELRRAQQRMAATW